MSLFTSNNPALKEEAFTQSAETQLVDGPAMTLNGTIGKSALLVGIVLVFAVFAWDLFSMMGVPLPFLIAIPLVGVGLAFLITFKKHWAAYIAPVYCALQGLFLGGVSGMLELKFPGIANQAMLLTFTVFGAMLLLYSTRVIRATERFKSIIITATFGIFCYYMISFVLQFFGVEMALIHSSGMAGIIFSLFVVIIAAMNLILDFDTIEQGVAHSAPKNMEWYAAFGLTVTLIWLYIEILRLLSKLNSRN
ncbi:Bax inhibitor-1/YccA family protein [Rufibacter glacialis]|uniref:Bax inhibitor-1/YccA family protein n=1 Tax=Rufibacter glacialis TaxID=1259555 RepID=A0A5M8QF10_9BACT|nr:Bax inhibitor-1/YccA family protein [Rufibacter glacialis]KAA6433346.1 Bax inhibitor-1/YccA family protein [Rufibacter glacialis]GGK75130.1 membrane protein [Rufibacter glacialis]